MLSSKPLDNLPSQILRFCLQKYNYSISHVPGKSLFTADTLSRAPAPDNHDDSTSLQNETEAFVAAMASKLPAISDRLEEFRKAQAVDQTLSQVINFCQTEGQMNQQLVVWKSFTGKSELRFLFANNFFYVETE